jgi:hypothetical protein
MRHAATDVLDVAYEVSGPAAAPAVRATGAASPSRTMRSR